MFEILGHLLYHLIRRSLICIIVTEKGVQCISLNGTTYAATTLVFNEDCVLGKLSPLSGYPVLYTFFRQKLTTALLESAEGRE